MSDSNDQGRWSRHDRRRVPSPKVDAFLAAIEEVCERFGYAIGHEDTGGGFVIELYEEGDPGWIQGASLGDSVAREEQR